MSSTLIMRKTPVPAKNSEVGFGLPVKGMIARKFYGHDGSLGGGMLTVGDDCTEWFEGLLAGLNYNGKEAKDLERMVQVLRDGGTVDMWFEV